MYHVITTTTCAKSSLFDGNYLTDTNATNIDDLVVDKCEFFSINRCEMILNYAAIKKNDQTKTNHSVSIQSLIQQKFLEYCYRVMIIITVLCVSQQIL